MVEPVRFNVGFEMTPRSSGLSDLEAELRIGECGVLHLRGEFRIVARDSNENKLYAYCTYCGSVYGRDIVEEEDGGGQGPMEKISKMNLGDEC